MSGNQAPRAPEQDLSEYPSYGSRDVERLQETDPPRYRCRGCGDTFTLSQ